jgi:acyl-CoA synthetase (AMP-forming)/AMP-acid ligase II
MLGRVAREAAERFGDDTAYVAPAGWALSYRDLDRLADEVAVGLAARGVCEGDVVALVLPQTPEHLVAYVAAARIGAVTAGVNPRLAAPERAAVLAAARPRLVLAAPDLAPAGLDMEVVAVHPVDAAGDALSDLRGPGAPPALADDPERPVALVFTSGTTGTPKGAVFASRQLAFITQVDTGGRWAERGATGAAFAATPLPHLGQVTKLPGTLMRGGATHLLPRWTAGDALRLTAELHMAAIGGIPTQVALMLQHPDFDRYDLSGVRAIVLGGGPATPALVREARERFGAAVAIRYSCTEAGIGIGTALDAPAEDAEVSVGRPHAGVDLSVRDGDDPARALPAGEVGEVCLRSPAVMSGYWLQPELTAAAFTPDGFVRTGDLGYVDDAGRLRLVGRSKEMYVRGGYNVYPMEVEGLLAQHPAVAGVAVASRPDDLMGEVGVACVVLRAGAPAPTLDDLRTFAGGKVASYKLPDDVVVLDALPLTSMEKLDRRALAALVAVG